MATIPGSARLLIVPATTFQGDNPSPEKSEPTTNTGVMVPSGSIQAENPITTGVTWAIPSSASNRPCVFVLTRERSSKHFAPFETIHKSVDA